MQWKKEKELGATVSGRRLVRFKKKGRERRRMGAGSLASTRQWKADAMEPPPLLANPVTRRHGRGGGDADRWGLLTGGLGREGKVKTSI